MTVNTVSGPIEGTQLGVTLTHEHVLVLSPGLRAAYPSTFPRDEVLTACIDQLRALRRAGVQTMVDHSPYDLGRDPELLAEAANASGIQIICCTGVWINPARYFQLRDPAEIATLFISDLTEGITGTAVRAGVIKCAIDTDGLTPAVERVARAAALAHRETGAPISTHTHAPSRSGALLQRLLESCGVAGDRLIIGHCGDSEDLAYLRGLLARGSYLGMDRFGAEDILSDARRMDVVAALCAQGHTERLLLSQDANCWNDRQTRAQMATQRPHWHHRRVVEHVIPGLLDRGVTKQQIDTMLIDNPRRILDGDS